MRTLIDAAARRLLFSLDAEAAHDLSIKALKCGLVPASSPPANRRLAVELAGLSLPNPIGMAAGYDKNGEVVDALLRLGFGFTEAGSITPNPQPGNPRPRIFRLEAHKGVINRLGFNNEGHEACLARLKARVDRGGVLGVNIGANKDSADRTADYVAGVERFAPFAGYLAVNISSPNTPGLRDLQARAALDDLLKRVMAARDATTEQAGRKVPVFLKIAPDLGETDMDDIAEAVANAGTDGLIISNTTLARSEVAGHPSAGEIGGLSGAPLFERSTIVLAKMRRRMGADFPIIGVGGITDAVSALTKLEAGANAVQLYSGLVYGGPGLIARMLKEMIARLDRDGVPSISAYTNRANDFWADKLLPAPE